MKESIVKKSIASLVLGGTLLGMLTSWGNIPETFAQENPEILVTQSSSQIEITNIKGFKGVIVTLGITPDGETLIVGSNDGQLTAINLNNLEPIYSQLASTNPYSDIAFSSDGRLFAISSKQRVIVLETETGRIISSLNRHNGNVSSVAISPDDRILVSASGEDLTLKIWDLERGTLIEDIGENVDSVSTVAFSPDGRFFATGAGGIGSDRVVKFWDAETFALLETLPKQFGFIYDLAFNSDGSKLVGAVKNYVKVWDLDNANREILSLKASPLDINRVAFSPDNRWIATANKEGKIQIIDVKQNRVITTLTGHKGWVQTIAFSPDGQILFSGAEDKIVKVWDLSNF